MLVGANRLRPTGAATTVGPRRRRAAGHRRTYADSKEQLAGYYLIETPDLDAALGWAARCPTCSHGVVELAPGLGDVSG